MNIELKPIAESKVRQLGGEVCGVLVRKDDKLAAVDEHGRVQWLQSGQGAEPVAKDIVMQALDNLLYDNYELSYAGYQNRKSDADLIRSFLGTHSRPAKQGVMLECAHCGGTGDVSGEYPGVMCPACGGTCKVYPQPAQQGSVPSRDDLVQCLLATRGQSEGVAADAILSLFSATTSQPAQQGSVPEGWKLVPVEPTTEMRYAYHEAYQRYLEGSIPSPDGQWWAMLDAAPQPEGDVVAVPVAALEYLKDQWPGAYAKFYERICSNKHPQPPKEGE